MLGLVHAYLSCFSCSFSVPPAGLTQQQETNASNNQPTCDLASAVNAAKDFAEKDGDDITGWRKELAMLVNIFPLNEPAASRLIVSKLRGCAQTLTASLILEKPWLESEDILQELGKHFANTSKNHP